jgi:hypothetical protein
MEPGGGGGTMDRPCQRCGRSFASDSRFCPFCGASAAAPSPQAYVPGWYPLPHKSTWQSIKEAVRTASTWFIFLVLIEVTVNVGILIWGSTLVMPNIPGYSKLLYIITPWIVDIYKLEGYTLSGYFFFLMLAIVISYAYMLFRSLPQLPKELKGDEVKEHTPLYRIGTLFCATVFCSFLVYGLLALFDVNPTVPEFAELPLWKQIFSMAGASVYEEVVCRILLIGVPLFVYHVITRQDRDHKRYVLGGNIAIDRPALLLLIFSSAMFAAAHLFIWDFWKLVPTFVSGLALGYLFLRYGVYASIMLHFFIDFLSMPMEVWPSGGLANVVIILLELGILLVGAAYFVYYVLKVLDFVNGGPVIKRKAKPAAMGAYQPLHTPPAMSPQPAPPPQNQFAFRCQRCGNGEARYQDGALYCTRCGQRK